ncbi:MAG: exonuclease SbcCD subunit D [Fusicatenibacter sp.]
MKLLHTADLHIGKRVNEFSMLEDQAYILGQMLQIAREEKVDAVIIAGDVYDKTVPPQEAVQLFDWFLTELNQREIPVCVVTGNHDSTERVSFASRILEGRGVYVTPVYDGMVKPIEFKDAYGSVRIWMLPFLKPAYVRRAFPNEEVTTYQEAVKLAVEKLPMNPLGRNVLAAHQFVTGAVPAGSEDFLGVEGMDLQVGGIDQVDGSIFSSFDYTALGHIHRAGAAGSPVIRYSGTPLKYSFSEIRHKKSVTIVELLEKGTVHCRQIPLVPKRDMRAIYGSYEELTRKSNYEGSNLDDYIRITLTDENDIPDAIGKLRSIYPNIMKLDYDNQRTRSSQMVDELPEEKRKTPLELLEDFYVLQNNQPMGKEQEAFAGELIRKIWET